MAWCEADGIVVPKFNDCRDLQCQSGPYPYIEPKRLFARVSNSERGSKTDFKTEPDTVVFQTAKVKLLPLPHHPLLCLTVTLMDSRMIARRGGERVRLLWPRLGRLPRRSPHRVRLCLLLALGLWLLLLLLLLLLLPRGRSSPRCP
jgi:hypothetical protein